MSKAVATPIIIENLGLLDLNKTLGLFVGFLPSNSKSVIVSYAPNLTISCVIPPVSHEVLVLYQKFSRKYDYDDYEDHWDKDPELKKVKHSAPCTLMSIGYADISSMTRPHPYGFGIFAIDGKKQDKIWGAPYLLPNVGSDGRICFGQVGSPKDLRSAYSIFWNSPFNDHVDWNASKDAASTLDYVKRYKSLVLKDQDFKDLTNQICGTKFWSTTDVAEGILITSSTELLKKIPNKFWIKDKYDIPFIIAMGNSENGKWLFKGKGFQFELDSKFVATPQSTKHKLITLEKKFNVAPKNTTIPTTIVQVATITPMKSTNPTKIKTKVKTAVKTTTKKTTTKKVTTKKTKTKVKEKI